MSAIKVKVSELYEQVKLMKDDGMIYATCQFWNKTLNMMYQLLYL